MWTGSHGEGPKDVVRQAAALGYDAQAIADFDAGIVWDLWILKPGGARELYDSYDVQRDALLQSIEMRREGHQVQVVSRQANRGA